MSFGLLVLSSYCWLSLSVVMDFVHVRIGGRLFGLMKGGWWIAVRWWDMRSVMDQHTLATADCNRRTVQFEQVAMTHQTVVSWGMMFGEVVG
jgi:hypothetical protein